MSNQYRARKNDFLRDLIYELIYLDTNTVSIYKFIRKIISNFEESTPRISDSKIEKEFHFSIHELDLNCAIIFFK